VMKLNLGNVVVTGASGFVGRHITNILPVDRVIPLSVRAGDDCQAVLARCCAGREVGVLIHAGGRAHVRGSSTRKEEELHHRDNFELTRSLARAAVTAGIRRFVFISTIQVLGTRSRPGRPLMGNEKPAPSSGYARSKLRAEEELRRISATCGLEVSIVRPALVCGAGAAGNLARLASAIEAGIPMPFAAVDNRRSMVNVRDLADLVVGLADSRDLPNSPLVAADANLVSTGELIRMLADALNRPARLFRVPSPLLWGAFHAVGQASKAQQLLGSLEADIRATCEATGWTPRHGLADGLAALARERVRQALGQT